MNCNEILPLICGYLDGENTESENKCLQDHLKTCARCRESMAEMQANDRLLADAPEAPAELTWRIMQQVRKEPKKQNRWKRWSAVLSAAAVLAVVLLSGVLFPAMEKRSEAMADEEISTESAVMYRHITEEPAEVAMEATLAAPMPTESKAAYAAFLAMEPVSVTEDFVPIALADATVFLSDDALALLNSLTVEDLQVYFVPWYIIDELKASGSVELLSEDAEADNYIIFLSNAETP